MLAIVRSATKQTLPRYSGATGKNELTLMVVVEVDFTMDGSGEVRHRQKYAVLPEDVDLAVFQKQADVMQDDLDHESATAERRALAAEQDTLADRQIEGLLKKRYVREVGDVIPVNEGLK